MNRRAYIENGTTYLRVSKARARRLYNTGGEVRISPCNMRPDSPWGCPMPISNKSDRTFDAVVTEYEVFTCANRKVGLHVAFYAPVPEEWA